MEKIFKYIPTGVCSSEFTFIIENDIIRKMEIKGGCPGNLIGITKLCINQNIDDIINKLKNIKCGNKKTSCPDQIAIALEKYKLEK